MTIENNNPGVQPQPIGLAELPAHAGAGATVLAPNMRLFDSVQVSLSVVVGQAQSSIGELMGLKESAVLKIERGVDQPVDVMFNGVVVARGQLVAVDDNFGVRITEVAQNTVS